MDKTRQGSGHTGRKGGRRGGFRDPAFREMVRNGEISPSAEITPENLRRTNGNPDHKGTVEYTRKNYAQMETLLNYFDEDWFDYDGFIKDESEGIARKRTGTSSKMFKCSSCNKPWSSGELSEPEYYDKSLFKNIPMEKKLCLKCDDALPVVVD